MVDTFDVDLVLSAVRALLDADATLTGATYLTETGRVYTSRCPSDKSDDLPYIVVTMLPMGIDAMNLHSGELRISNYYALLKNGQPNAKADEITKLCRQILNNSMPTIAGGAVLPLTAIGVIPAFVDLAHPRQSIGVVRFRVEAGMSG